MFFAVNNEVETRSEEPGYEVAQNLDLRFDDFGPFLIFFKWLKNASVRNLDSYHC